MKLRSAPLTGLSPRRHGMETLTLLVIGTLLLLHLAGHTSNRLWSNLDFWVWLGPVREFAAHPLHPSHPLLSVGAGDSYMGPYSFVLGIATRLSGMDAVSVMAFAGMVNATLLIVAVRRLALTTSKHAWSPSVLLLLTLLAWGWQPWRWSGYPNLNSLGTVLPLGSTFAYATALLSLSSFMRWRSTGATRPLALATVLLATTVLTHQATGLWVSLVVVSVVLGRGVPLTRRVVALFVLAAVIATALVAIWPFYSATELLASANDFDLINRGTLEHVAAGTFLAWPGVILLGSRLRKDRRDPIAIAALLLLVVFATGWFLDRGSLGRVMPGLILMSHLAMADWFAGRLSTPTDAVRSTRAIRIGLIAILLTGTAGTATNWLRSIPRSVVPIAMGEKLRLRSYVAPNLEFERFFSDGDVVAAVQRVSLPIGATAASVIAVQIPEPLIDDHPARLAAVDEMLDPSTAPERRRLIIDDYGVTFLAVEKSDAARLLEQLPGSAVVGTVNGCALISLHPS